MKVVLLLFLLKISFFCRATAQLDHLRIVEPYPKKYAYVKLFSSVNITCAAFDSSGKDVPGKFTFVRQNESSSIIVKQLEANDNLYFTNRTEKRDNKTKLFVTLHIRHVTMDFDSIYGAFTWYTCRLYAAGAPYYNDSFFFKIITATAHNLKIVEHSHGNAAIFVKFSSANITCVAFDSSGLKVPEKITFTRYNWSDFENNQELEANDNMYFTNRTETQDNKIKLSVTLHIRNITMDFDSDYSTPAMYECHPNYETDGRYLFTVHVVPAQTLKCHTLECHGPICSNTTLRNMYSKEQYCLYGNDRCFQYYIRSLTGFETGCASQTVCEEAYIQCIDMMRKNESECCNVTCCNSTLCNKWEYTDESRLCKRKQNIVAVIYGGAEVYRGLNGNIAMNGSLSYDPETGDNKGMNFTWRYGSIPTNNYSSDQLLKQELFAAVNVSSVDNLRIRFGRVITISSNVTNDNETFIVNLTVTKDYRTSNVSQVVHLVRGDPPKIYQRCLINCGLKRIPSVKLSIESICQGSQCSQITSYNWILSEEDQLWKRRNDLHLMASTSLNSSRIVIREGSLEGGKNYRLAVFVRTADGFSGMSAYYFLAALPPSGGTCTIEPASGISLKTYFNLSCSDWTSDSIPLSYHFQYQLYNGLNSVVYHGFNTSVSSVLPSGDLSGNFTLRLTVTVTDRNGASAPNVNLYVQVRPFENLTSENITSFIVAQDSPLNEAINVGDLDKAVQIANAVIQAISRDSALDQSGKTEIQEYIVDRITTLQVENLPDLLQISSVIGSATQDTDTVSERSLNTSLPAIDSMTSLLMSKSQAKESPDIPLIIKSAENLGSCLNNMLKAGAVIASRNINTGQGRHVVTGCMQLVNTVSDAVLELTVPDEEVVSIQTSGMAFSLGRHTPTKLAGLKIESDNGTFVLPADTDALVSRLTNNSFVDTQMLSIPFNPFTWDRTRERVNSDVLTLDLKDDKRKGIELSQLSNDVLIEIPLKAQNNTPGTPLHFFTKKNVPRIHEVNVVYENTMMLLDISPEGATATLVMYMGFGHRPTIQEHDFNATISRHGRCIWTRTSETLEGKSGCSSNVLTPIHILAKKPGMYYLAVESHNNLRKPQMRQKRSCFGLRRQKRSCVEVKSPPPTTPQSKNITVVPVYDPSTDQNYTLRVSMGSCVYWSDKRQIWITDGCHVLSANSSGSVSCSCNHLTSFGGSLLVKPNPIDFDQVFVEFKKLEETGNVAVIVTVSVAFFIYFLVLFAARKADKRDAKTCSPTSKLHISSSDTYEYEITITTGIWRNAGTSAKVAIEMYGDEGSTGIIKLSTDSGLNDSLFYRGSSVAFVLDIGKPLGFVHEVRIGHDNSGLAPSWFLEDVVIMDKQTQRSWTFSNSQWLALERGDGRIERTLELSENGTAFKSDLLKRWWKGLTEKHIWVSVIAKSPNDRFSRVHRASCCLSILLSAMLANAMFYELKGKSAQVIQVGPLKFSWTQVIIGIQSVLIVAPLNILIVFLFKKGSSRTNEQPKCCVHTLLVYVAWFLCFCTCVVSATFSIFYSLVWGKSISEQWLSSMLISFAQSVAVNEPVKVFFAAVFLATIIRFKRGKSDDYSAVGAPVVGENENICSKRRLWTMDISEVEEMRRRQAKKQNMSHFYVELIVYCVFVFILMVVCYGNRNDHRYLMTKSTRNGLPQFHKVSNNTRYWSWLRRVFLPGVYAGTWYNGQEEKHTVYIGNKHSVLVGMPRLRQLRVTPKPCNVLDYMEPTFPVCYGAYSEKNEDSTPYNKPGWIPVDNSTKKDDLNRLCPKPWRYQKPGETDAVPKWGQFSFYPGGGYVADLGYEEKIGLTITEMLQKNNWLDLQSRPVILEFSAFNPSTNLLVVAIYFYEIQPSGYSAPFERIEIISVYSGETGSHQFYLMCILIFIIFVFLFVARMCYRVCKQRSKYFKSFWNWVEIFQVVVSVLAIVMNILQSAKTVSTVRKMKENVYSNVNFQEVIAWTEAENGVLGILVFIVTMKFLRLIRFNEHVAIFSRTLRISAKVLRSFMLVFVIGFMAFLHFGILIFGTGTVRYSSFRKATYFQFELILGRVKARPINELSDTNHTFGRIFAALLLISLTIMFMNFFISAINDAVSNAKNFVLPNELYALADECSSSHGKNKTFFDAISKALRQRTTENKPSRSHTKMGDKLTQSSCTWPIVDFDSISKAIVASRQTTNRESSLTKPDTTRKRSFFDRVSGQLKHIRDTRTITKFQLKKLRNKEKQMFDLLDDIVQSYSNDETFRVNTTSTMTLLSPACESDSAVLACER